MHKFKGLEREVVILAGLDDKSTQGGHATLVSQLPKEGAVPAGGPGVVNAGVSAGDGSLRSEELLYVGLSRACNHLILVVKDSAADYWRQLLR